MTLADNYAPTKVQGNGVTDAFTFDWNAISSSYVVVTFEDTTTGVQTVQSSGFTTVLDDDGVGGTVTFVTPPPATVYVILSREVPASNATSYTTSGGFQAKVVENNFDSAMAVVQQDKDDLSRTPKTKKGGTEDVVFPDAEAEKIPGWGATGSEETMVNYDNPTASADAAAASAAAALVSENNAAASEAATAADVVTTNADVVLTGLDVDATNADVVLTNADVVLTGLDVDATNADVIAAAASASAAAASAASLPAISEGDAGKILQVNVGETGYDFIELPEAAGGKILQVVHSPVGAVVTSTDTDALDDNIPNTSDLTDDFITAAITPTASGNRIIAVASWNSAYSGGGDIVGAMFKDAVANSIGCIWYKGQAANEVIQQGFAVELTAPDTSEITLKLRLGGTSGTITMNGVGGARKGGGVMASTLTLYEIDES